MTIEMKTAFGGAARAGFVMDAAKVETINGVETGVIEGYIASFEPEDNFYPDQFIKGAFLDSINEHKARDNRPVRFNYMHKRDPIGGFPIDTVFEDARGLFGKGHIALVDDRGNSLYQRAKAGFLSDFSIGYNADPNAVRFETMDDGRELRLIGKARIREGSLVDEGMNPDAQVTGVKHDQVLGIDDLKGMTERELEAFLAESGTLSRKAAAAISSSCKVLTRQEEDPAVLSRLMEGLKNIRTDLQTKS